MVCAPHMHSHIRSLLWLVVLACPTHSFATPTDGTTPGAQGGPEAELNKQISVRLAVFRDKQATPDDRAVAAREIAELGWRGPWRLVAEMQRRTTAVKSDTGQLLRKVVTGFRKRSRALIKKRMTKKARAEIDRLRDVVLKAARDPKLSKQRIRAESDPALARLRELQTVTPQQVWDSDEKLYRSYREALALIELHRELQSYWELGREHLLAHPDTPASKKRLDGVLQPEEQEDLDAAFEIFARAATPASQTDRKRLQTNRLLREQIDAEEFAGVEYLNEIRLLLGLPVQTIDVKLCTAARGHSKDMVERKFFAHESPVEGKKTPWMRAAAAGTSASAENIARGAKTGKAAITQWWYSPGHHRNMLGGQGRTGLGRYRETWTQLFG